MLTRKFRYTIWVILALLSFVVVVPFCVFPGEAYYRELIKSASDVELQYLPAPNYSRYFTMAKIPGSARVSLDKLSAIIDFHGVWVPFMDVSGNVYRIRVTKQDSSCEDVVVLGGNTLRNGSWHIAVAPEAVETIKQIVVESGGQLPDNDILLKLLGQEDNNTTTPNITQEAEQNSPPKNSGN